MWVRAYMDMSTDRQTDRPYSQLLAAVLAQNTAPPLGWGLVAPGCLLAPVLSF